MARKQAEVRYYDRYVGETLTEAIYGEKALRWAYETALGRLCLEGVIKRPWFSALYGKWADCGCSRKEIAPFVERFGLDPSEFLEPVESYRTFNDFFSRRLRPEARPIASGENDVVFPADGRHLFVPDLSEATTLWAKGQRFDLPTLLGNGELAGRFGDGAALISRLCPTDYHRFHFPAAGTPGEPRLVKGELYSVNPIALAGALSCLWRNKRRITEVTNSPLGDYLFLEIGATNVGSIVSTNEPGVPVVRGDEKGTFRFGGSMTMILFGKGSFVPACDLAAQSGLGTELYAKFGDRAGAVRE